MTAQPTTPAPAPDPRAVLGVQINTLDLGLGIATATVVLEDGTIQTAQWPVTLVAVDRVQPMPDSGLVPTEAQRLPSVGLDGYNQPA